MSMNLNFEFVYTFIFVDIKRIAGTFETHEIKKNIYQNEICRKKSIYFSVLDSIYKANFNNKIV